MAHKLIVTLCNTQGTELVNKHILISDPSDCTLEGLEKYADKLLKNGLDLAKDRGVKTANDSLVLLYKDLKNAARKHRDACSVLLDGTTKEMSSQKKMDLFFNVYYLSGYVLECGLKYAIFYFIKWEKNRAIETLNQDEHSLDYDTDLKTHKLEKLENILRDINQDIFRADLPIFGVKKDKQIRKMFNLWDSQIRYYPQRLLLNLLSFIEKDRLLENIQSFFNSVNLFFEYLDEKL